MRAVRQDAQKRNQGAFAQFLLLMVICSMTLSGCAGLVSGNGSQPQTPPPTNTAPIIATQPASQSVVVGQTATFAVVATGTAPLTYQWQKNGASISGATSASYTTPATVSGDNSSTFKVVVTNSAGSATSNAATLTVTATAVAPTITAQPANQTAAAGQTATFTVVATGTAPLTYLWQKNGANISGATSATYTTPATVSGDSGSTFKVIVTNSAGAATSNSATLTVSAAGVAPAITTQPTNKSVTVGQTATFTVVATGTAPLSYQWQKNGANISGATSASYTTPPTVGGDSGSTFKVIVSNAAGSATSNAATLTVTATAVAPTITTQPVAVSVTVGQTATFIVVATGTAPLTYQWQKNGANISGATLATYVTPATVAGDSGSTFKVVVSNAAGSATSNPVTLTVTATAVAPTISTQPTAETVSVGQTATFMVAATGTAPLTYQWQKNGANISGATSSSYTTPATVTGDSGSTFKVVVSNAAGSATSSAATLTVTGDTTAPSVPTGLSASALSSSQIGLTWNASTDNVGVQGYKVFRAGTQIATSPTTSYQDSGLAAGITFSYTVAAYDAAGNTSAQSASASATTLASGGSGIPNTLGWFQIPNSTMQPICPANTAQYAFNSNCDNVVAAWSGGIADTTRNRMIIWGGGHNDYYGNEIYSLDLNALTMSRLNNPSPLNANLANCTSGLSDGSANTRHTYGGISYITHADKMYVFSGIVACTNGGGTNDTWTLDMSTLGWHSQDPTNGAPPSLVIALGVSDYDPTTKNVFVDSVNNFSSYNYDTNTYKILNNTAYLTYHMSGVIDPIRRLFIMFGGSGDSDPGGIQVFDISGTNNYPESDWNSQVTGCSALQAADYPGLAYDPVTKTIVGWAGGNSVYVFNPDTKTCTQVTYPNGPGTAQANGTNGRFRYFPSLGVFAVVNSVTENAYTLRIDPAVVQPLAISNVATSNVNSTSATVTWATNNTANSQVSYGTTTAYGSTTTLDTNQVTSHSENLTGLTPSTTYHFKVTSTDGGGNTVNSGDFTFTTGAVSVVAPVISNVVVSSLTTTSAIITWTTDQISTSQVAYGPTTSYGSTSTLDVTLLTIHTATLTGLTPSTLYHFQAQSKNAGGTTGVSADSTFSTASGTPPPPTSDTAIIHETSGTAQTNRAVSLSRPFVQGEIANFAQASIGGTPVLTQCDVKNRWPDGSLKFAIVSFVIPSLSANGSVTVSFTNQATGNNTGFLAQADMLAAGYNFDAHINETGTANHSISARTMLTNGNFRYWLQGPIVTAAIIEDRSSTRAYDFNSDGGAGNPLHPIFEAWFYPQGNRVEIGYTVENVWAGSTVSNSMRDQTYSVVLTSGQNNPVTELTQASFNHIGRSRWYRPFWLGNNAPAAVRIDHNLGYLTATKVIPNYDTSLVLDNPLVAAEYASFGGTTQPFTSGGNIPVDMNAGGAADSIGLMTKWETMYLYTMGTDDRMLTMTLGNAQLEGRVPYHYREADTNLFFDTGNSVNAFGHIISVNARPMINLGIGFNSDFNDNCTGSNTKTLNIGNVTADGWDTNGMDSSHWPSFGFVAYLITGKYYYMEETAFAGGYMTGWSGGCPGGRRDGAAGVLDQPQPGRGVAWSFRAVSHAWLSSPDGTPEQAYFYDKLENSIASFEGEHGIAISDATRQTVWNWGKANEMDSNGASPLHFWNQGDPGFVESPMRTDGFVASAWSPWEESYLFSTFGMARDAGLDHVGDLLQWGANRWFHLALDTTNVNNIYLVGTYRFPTKLGSTNNWLTNYADYKTAFLGNGDGLPTSWTYFWSCNYAPDDDKRYEGMATIGFLYPYTADGFSGQNAWNAVHTSMWNTSGCLPADFQNGSNASPKWAILARTN